MNSYTRLHLREFIWIDELCDLTYVNWHILIHIFQSIIVRIDMCEFIYFLYQFIYTNLYLLCFCMNSYIQLHLCEFVWINELCDLPYVNWHISIHIFQSIIVRIDMCEFIYLYDIMWTDICHFTYQFALYEMMYIILYIILLHILSICHLSVQY